MAELDRIVKVNISRGFAGITTRDFGMILLVGNRENFKPSVFEMESSVFTLRSLDEAKQYLKYNDYPAEISDSLKSYSDNELYQMLRIFFGMTGRPPRIKIAYLNDNENFSTAYKRIANHDNEWYYCVLSPSVRAKLDNDNDMNDMIGVFNNQFIEDVHFSVLQDTIGKNIAENAALTKLLRPTTKSSSAVGTVKNLLVLNENSENNSLEKYFALGVAMALAVREGGTYNPCYMSLPPAFKADKLSSGTVKEIIRNNANCYHLLAGTTAFENGRCTGTYVLGQEMKEETGEWVDTVVFIDLMRARLQEAIFGTLKSASDARSKIPYTDKGIDVLDFKATTLLNQWVRNGQIVSFQPNHTPVSEVSSADKINRRYDGLSYTAQLAGAINTVVINVNLED